MDRSFNGLQFPFVIHDASVVVVAAGTELPASASPFSDHWNELHRYFFTTSEGCESFYIDWTNRIPSIGCDCMSHWRDLTAKYPPDFSSAKAFFEWGWARHNDVNERLGKPVFALDEAYSMHFPAVWIDHEELPVTPLSDRLVITLGIGDRYEKLLDISGPTIKAYAKRCKADFIALTDATQKWWGLEKFRVKWFQQHYKRILFVDCDVLIKPNAPDLFELVPEDSIGILNEWNEIKEVFETDWLIWHRRDLYSSQGLIKDKNFETSFNSGVVLSSSHHDIWKGMDRPFLKRHTDEQMWIEQQCHNYTISDLDLRFNTQWWMRDFQQRKLSAWMIHFASCPADKRLEEMAKEVKSWRSLE